jgi:hypothetical protein
VKPKWLFEHTPQHLYDVDDPCFGFVAGPALVAATEATTRPRQQLGSCCVAVLASVVSGSTPPCFFGGRAALLGL